MKFLIITDEYLPKSTRVTPKMMHEMALEITKLGHKVIVLTTGQPDQLQLLVKDFVEQIEVWRFKSGYVKDVSRIRRLVNESLFSYKAWKSIKPELSIESFDGIIYSSPSIFFGFLVAQIKKQFNCRSYLILRDLFPQWVIDEKIISKYSPIAYYLRFFEKKNYMAADKIGMMSEKNIEVFNNIYPGLYNLEVLRNWVNNENLKSVQPYWREQLGLQDKIILLYGGNIGHAQDMPNIMRLIHSMKSVKKAHFLIVGQGESYQDVAKFIEKKDLTNVTLMPSISQEKFKILLTEVDIGLFSLARTHTAHNFPGKILGYIANSIPILGSVNTGNDLMPLINQHKAGFVFENGKDHDLFEAAKQLILSDNLRSSCGNNSKKLLNTYFSVQVAAKKIIKGLEK